MAPEFQHYPWQTTIKFYIPHSKFILLTPATIPAIIPLYE